MIPLAERMRPKTLDQLTGQEHLVGPDSILRKALESGHLTTQFTMRNVVQEKPMREPSD